jgi:hypothetical protein
VSIVTVIAECPSRYCTTFDALTSSHDTLSSVQNLIETAKITAKRGLEPHDRCAVFELFREAAHGLDADWQ